MSLASNLEFMSFNFSSQHSFKQQISVLHTGIELKYLDIQKIIHFPKSLRV